MDNRQTGLTQAPNADAKMNNMELLEYVFLIGLS